MSKAFFWIFASFSEKKWLSISVSQLKCGNECKTCGGATSRENWGGLPLLAQTCSVQVMCIIITYALLSWSLHTHTTYTHKHTTKGIKTTQWNFINEKIIIKVWVDDKTFCKGCWTKMLQLQHCSHIQRQRLEEECGREISPSQGVIPCNL